MTCYKCKTTENLSIKSSNPKTGYKLMVCRQCRRSAENERNKHIRLPKIDKDWEARARESYLRISRKYKRVEA